MKRRDKNFEETASSFNVKNGVARFVQHNRVCLSHEEWGFIDTGPF